MSCSNRELTVHAMLIFSFINFFCPIFISHKNRISQKNIKIHISIIDARNGRGTPTSPEPIMSSFRPGPAKLYACPEDVKPVAYRGTKGTANRREGGKGRSQSLPPNGARPQVYIFILDIIALRK
jgi:hypothetical protein